MWSVARGEPRPISAVHLPQQGGSYEPVIKLMGMVLSSGLISICVAQIVHGSLEIGLRSDMLTKADQASGLSVVVRSAPSSQVMRLSLKLASDGYPKMRRPYLLMQAFISTFPSILHRADLQGVTFQMSSSIPKNRGAGKERTTLLRAVTGNE